jgi:hypothetical protein
MAFDPESIMRIGLGSIDYPEGEAVRGKYGWHVLELILDDEGNWNDKVFQSNQMNATTEEIISKLSKTFYLEFELDVAWKDFQTYLTQFGKLGKEITGSFNGEDFEDLVGAKK